MAGLDKAARLDYGESLMTHAMVFQGVNFDGEGKPTLWRVENSWGKDHGHDGYDLMTDELVLGVCLSGRRRQEISHRG